MRLLVLLTAAFNKLVSRSVPDPGQYQFGMMWRCHLHITQYPGTREVFTQSWATSTVRIHTMCLTCRDILLELSIIPGSPVSSITIFDGEKNRVASAGDGQTSRQESPIARSSLIQSPNKIICSSPSRCKVAGAIHWFDHIITHGESCRLTLHHINGWNSADMEHRWRLTST